MNIPRRRLTRDASKREIIIAAGHLALRVGLQNITRDAVANEAGRAAGTVSKYFTIEELRDAVLIVAIEENNPLVLATGMGYPVHARIASAPESLLKKARKLL